MRSGLDPIQNRPRPRSRSLPPPRIQQKTEDENEDEDETFRYLGEASTEHSQVCAGESAEGFGATRSPRRVSRNTSPTPVQMALSATLKAGKPTSPPPRCCR